MWMPFRNEKVDEIEKASELCASSLLNTPSYVEIFRGTEEQRHRMMKVLFIKNIKMNAARNSEVLHYSYGEISELECFFMMVPNNFANFSLCEKIGGGLLELPFHCGFNATNRLLAAGDWFEKVEKELVHDYPVYFHLQRMVVAPNKQGLGIGSKLLSAALAETDKLQIPVLLDTQDLRNVAFYGKLGFKQIHSQEFVADDPKYSYMSYWMIRIPEPDSPSNNPAGNRVSVLERLELQN